LRYATVVVQRFIARVLGDWHRRSLERSAPVAQDRGYRLDVQAFLSTLTARLATHAVAFIRFLAVSSPPADLSTASSDAGAPKPRPRRPGAYPVVPAVRLHEPAALPVAHPARHVRLAHITHALVAWMRPFATLLMGTGHRPLIPGTGPAESRPRSMGWAAQQRVLGGAVALLVLVASIVGVSPVRSPADGTGNVVGAGDVTRTVVGGGTSGAAPVTFGGQQDSTTPADAGAPATVHVAAFTPVQSADEFAPVDPAANLPDIEGFTETPGSQPDGVTRTADPAPAVVTESTEMGAYLADGTILKPIAVDTTVPDARTLLTRYKVRKGDTLTSIAHGYGLSLVTLYWANHLTTNLKTKTDLRVGQFLSIPPVNGVLHIVTDKETLQDISKRTKVSVSRIVAANGLKQPTVYVGQWIIVPGAKAKPIPVPAPKPVAKPAPKPVSRPATTRPVSRPTPKPVTRPTYSSGGWVWPVPSGHISQYYHYGHWALDIAANYGGSVLAAKAGVVIFAGWRNNGGGWQVWMAHGNGIYTTYNHMASLTVGTGQSVGAGRQVGRIGMTGHATGPHLHFEVWIGPIWAGGTRQNPLRYV